MRVAVLTVHQSISAGGSLQAYALCKVLRDLGHEVEIINYCPYYFMDFTDPSRRSEWRTPRGFLKKLLNGRRLQKHRGLFDDFAGNYLPPMTKRVNSPEELRDITLDYDAYVCGSDQIWNPPHVHYDTTWFLDFVKSGPRLVSYAASIGRDRLSEKDLGWLKRGASGFDSLSVREDTAVEVLGSLGLDAEQCVDPTFLLAPEEWRLLERKPEQEIPKEYLLYYSVECANPVELPLLNRVKEKTGLPCVVISTAFLKPSYAGVQVPLCGPRELLYLIDHASVVYSNSFHGMVFSIIFGKTLVSYKNMVSNSRLDSLMRLTGLQSCQVDGEEGYDQVDWQFVAEEFASAYAGMSEHIERSIRFLKGALA